MTKLYSTLILCLLSVSLFAQKSISGKILDEHAQTIPYASVTVLRHADSVKSHVAMTDTLGNFSFSGIPNGKYVIKISYMGYQDYYTEVIAIHPTAQHHHFGEIRLQSNSNLLGTVTIKGQRPLIEQTLDRTIMNVEKSILAEGNTAMELLAKAPGVTITESGAVSLKGRTGTLVMINGKQTYLSGDQLANLLRGTSSSSISRIEIIANPAANYDAAGSGGIVNIILKKNSLTGFNGAVTTNAGFGRGFRYGAGSSLNYRSNKLSLYGTYNSNNQNIESSVQTERNFYDVPKNTGGTIQQHSFQEMNETAKLRSHNFRAGADLQLDDKNTIGFLVNGAIGKYPASQTTLNSLTDKNSSLLLWNALTRIQGWENWRDFLYNVNYVHQFDKEGHEIKFDADYFSHFSNMDQRLDTRYQDSQGTDLREPGSRMIKIPSSNDIYTAKIDYSKPLGKQTKLDAGWKGSYVRTENDLQYDTLQHQLYVNDAGNSNQFIYKEHIQAAYLNFNQEWEKYSLQAGLRIEYTATEGHQVTTDSLFKRDYVGFFPSVFLTRNFGETHKLKAGYSRRIQRPSYWDLNPFRVYNDPSSYYEGNPYLNPSMVNALELGYSYKSRYFTSLSYNHTSAVIGEKIAQQGAENITFERPDNLGSFTNYGISFTASTNITTWWTGSQFLNLYHNRFKIGQSAAASSEINSSSTLSFNSQNNFNLADSWKAELSGYYSSGEVSGTTTTKAYSMVSAGLQKEMMKSKATIKLMVNDIFRGYRLRQEMMYQNISSYTRRNPDSRSFMLSFNYRFGNTGVTRNDRKTASEELKDRIK